MLHPLDFPGPDNTTNPLPMRERLYGPRTDPTQPERGILVALAFVLVGGSAIVGLLWLCHRVL